MTDKTAWEGQTQNPNPNACTCHPDDRPAGPCPQRFASSDCQLAALEAERDALREALDMCRAIIKFHVRNAGASCTMDDKTFSALDAFNAAVKALAISEKSE